MDPTEKEWLSVHMGHTKDVHDRFYRIHTDVLELAKISKVLYLSESGNMHAHKGQKLSELDIDDPALSFDRVIEATKADHDDEISAEGAQQVDINYSSDEEPQVPRGPKRMNASGRRLTKAEREAIFNHFKDGIASRKYTANKAACENFNISTGRQLDYQQIRNCVNSKVSV